MYRIKLTRKNNSIKLVQKTNQVRVKKIDKTIKLLHRGPRGAEGPEGPQGVQGMGMPPGGLENQVLQKASDADYDYKWLNPTYSDKTFRTDFTVTNNVVVTHNMAKYPAVSVTDTAGDEVVGTVSYIDTNSLIVTFNNPFSGTVTCN